MSIGTVVLADGRAVKALLLESGACADAFEVSSFADGRAFVASRLGE